MTVRANVLRANPVRGLLVRAHFVVNATYEQPQLPMLRLTVCLVCAISFVTGAEVATVTRAPGGSIRTVLSADIVVNKGSSLQREWTAASRCRPGKIFLNTVNHDDIPREHPICVSRK